MGGLNPAAETVGELFTQFRSGSKEAADRLVNLFYPELRRLAAAKMKEERTEHS